MPPLYFRIPFAIVWLANGLLCKVLDLVPRHQEIVARILGDEYAREITVLIGLGEIMLGFWVLSGGKWRWSVAVQVGGVLLMNVIEFLLARDLLLFGAWNALIALAYCAVVIYSEYRRTTTSQS
ncbi:hypothetical protein NT6N_34930 [Oceaniferula spumae]|uniref:DoxX family protein n=1 Tax=Oceaniferula spumae TaxID=2979115 RepID=A0AAT9FR45_9BACT